MASGEQDDHADRCGERLRHQCGDGRTHDAIAGHRAPTENEQRVEDEIQHDRAEHDVERQARLADAAHQRLEHGVEEDEDDADEGHAHEAERAGIDVGGDTEDLEQIRGQDIAERAEDDGADGDHHHGLGGDVVDHVLTTGAHVLRDERGAGHGEPGTERDDEEGDGKADGYGRHR